MSAALLSQMLSEKHQLDGDFQENLSSVSQYVAAPGMVFVVDGEWMVGWDGGEWVGLLTSVWA